MTTVEPTGASVFSPKIRDQSLVRKFVSQNGTGYVAINIFDGTNSVDPDPDTLTLTVWFNDVTAEYPTSTDPRGTIIINVDSTVIQREDIGKYYYNIGTEYTQYRGVLTAEWAYAVNGVQFTFYDYLQILDQMPFYEQCSDQERSVVERVSWMIGDMFDSTEGGPYLIEPFQTHFDYERIAQLQSIAVTRFNYLAFPITSYGVGSGVQSLPPQFSDIAVIGTYLELVRHFIRSYLEIPAFVGMNVTYTDRRDYFQRWMQVLQMEEPQYEKAVTMAKRSLLQLGRGSLLVSGGLYGPSAGLFITSMYSSQVRAFRFYPAAFAISFGMVK